VVGGGRWLCVGVGVCFGMEGRMEGFGCADGCLLIAAQFFVLRSGDKDLREDTESYRRRCMWMYR